jgi:hypothetical protein
MDFLAQIVVWLNAAANAVFGWLLAPVGELPGWVSATLVAVITGVLMLYVFKYTSNQRAIKAARDDIKANLYAIKLFKENVRVTVGAQVGILWGAARLLVLAIVPMLVMALPVTMLLAQLGLWYQARPLRVGEETVMTMKLADGDDSTWPDVRLKPSDALAVEIDRVRIRSKREYCWKIRARTGGSHQIQFDVNGKPETKEVAIGDDFMRVSTERPAWNWFDTLFNPWEPPLDPDSPVRSIAITYPERSSWTSGTDWWVVYFFIVSLVAAFCLRKPLGVNI